MKRFEIIKLAGLTTIGYWAIDNLKNNILGVWATRELAEYAIGSALLKESNACH